MIATGPAGAGAFSAVRPHLPAQCPAQPWRKAGKSPRPRRPHARAHPRPRVPIRSKKTSITLEEEAHNTSTTLAILKKYVYLQCRHHDAEHL